MTNNDQHDNDPHVKGKVTFEPLDMSQFESKELPEGVIGKTVKATMDYGENQMTANVTTSAIDAIFFHVQLEEPEDDSVMPYFIGWWSGTDNDEYYESEPFDLQAKTVKEAFTEIRNIRDEYNSAFNKDD